MINDLKVDADTWKYVDDTTVAETIPRGSLGNVQDVVSGVEEWSRLQEMQLNADKCKEMIIDFKRNTHHFSPLVLDGKELPVVSSAKILGLTISNNLKWNNHISECLKKASKRLYFIILLRRAHVPPTDIINFYCSTIRPVLEYCAPVFHHALPAYLSDDIERVQKRVLSIVSPYLSYKDNLAKFCLTTLKERRNELCANLFNSISTCPDHKLSHLLPPRNQAQYKLRHSRAYAIPRAHTQRFKRSFMPAMCMSV